MLTRAGNPLRLSTVAAPGVKPYTYLLETGKHARDHG
jgi:hypothetical protein